MKSKLLLGFGQTLAGLALGCAGWGTFALIVWAPTGQAATFEVDVSSAAFTLYTDPYTGKEIKLGGFSGLFPVPGDQGGTMVYTITDRGPNPDYISGGTTYKIFPRPDFVPRIITVEMLPTGKAAIRGVVPLKRPDGAWINGLPNTKPAAEKPYDLNLDVLPNNEDGLDTESVTMDPWGNFWVCEEYKPSIAMVAPDGTVQLRLVPQGTTTGTEVIPSYEVLPAVLTKRVTNRGMEGIACAQNGLLYVTLQRPLGNPTKDYSDGKFAADGTVIIPPSRNIRIVEVNLNTLFHNGPQPLVRQFIYRTEPTAKATDQKSVYASDLFSLTPAIFLVPERKTDKLFAFNVQPATDITPFEDANGKLVSDPSKTIEMLDQSQLSKLGIKTVKKTVLYAPMTAIDPLLAKCEGVCVVGRTIVLTHDNDFNLAEATLAPSPNPGGPLLQINLQTPANLPKLYTIPLPEEIVFDED